MEDDQLAGVLADVRDYLQAGGAGAERRRRACPRGRSGRRRACRRCSRSPSARCEGVAAEGLDARDATQLRLGEGAGGGHDEAGAEGVAAVGLDEPLLRVLVQVSAVARVWKRVSR